MSRKVKLTIKYSNCRSSYHKTGDEYIIDEDNTLCPPICMELWHYAYPYVWALLNGAKEDKPDGTKGTDVDVICPDQGRVHLHIELINDSDTYTSL